MPSQMLDPGRETLYRAARGKPVLVRVPELGCVLVDGQGDPNDSVTYREAIEALYALSYSLKFAVKKDEGLNYHVGPLEGLWWAQDMVAFGAARKADWLWTMMIAQPDLVTPERFERARDEVARKKVLPALDRARLARFEEGLCAQVLHVGPFSTEEVTIAGLHDFIYAQGMTFDGRHHKHHEIYLSDPRRSAPERWKTIVRQPVAE